MDPASQPSPSAELAQRSPTLPSASSAMALMNGQPGALGQVVAHTVLRAAIIGAGLYVAGHRYRTVRTALVSSLAIEAFVLGWAAYQRGQLARMAP